MSVAAIRALVCGHPQRLWGGKLLVMLQAFIDDSTSPIGDRRAYLAAYVQDAETWIRFSADWDEELRAEPAIEYFKMSEAAARGGQFRKFSSKQRYYKIFRLAQIIAKHRPWGFHTSVSVADFNRLLKPVVPLPMKTPYFPLCYAIMFGVSQVHHNLGVSLPCDFIFDHYDGLQAKVVSLMDIILSERSEPWIKLVGGTPVFRDEKIFLPIQAADMLAWHVRRRGDNNYPDDLDGLDDLLIVEGVHHFTEIDTATLQYLADSMAHMPWAGDVDTKKKWQALLPHIRASFGAKH